MSALLVAYLGLVVCATFIYRGVQDHRRDKYVDWKARWIGSTVLTARMLETSAGLDPSAYSDSCKAANLVLDTAVRNNAANAPDDELGEAVEEYFNSLVAFFNTCVSGPPAAELVARVQRDSDRMFAELLEADARYGI